MKHIKVDLLHYTPMTVLIDAVSMPYQKNQVDLTLAEKVINVLKHESVAEHISMSFLIDGASRTELQEHMRHRIASTTCESTRYTLQNILDSLDDVDYQEKLGIKYGYPIYAHFVLPDYISKAFKHEELYNQYETRLRDIYYNFLDFLEFCYNNDIPNDFVKYGLPEGYRTRFVWTINLRSLKNFLNLRLADNAHFEIRHVANLIKNSLKNTYIERFIK